MRSLWFKLMGAFVLVILIGVAIDSWLVSRATSSQFDRYVTQSGQLWSQRLAPGLADYYARTGSWQGVEAWLAGPSGGMMGGMMGGMAGGMTHAPGRSAGVDGMMDGMMGGDMWTWMGIRLLLADAEGTVVADSASRLAGRPLQAADLAAGTPVEVDGRRVGTLLAMPAAAQVATPAGDFLSAVTRSTWLAGLAAGAFALVLGLLLFRHIVAPVRAVTTAAQHVAAGQLDQRVPVSSRDEIGQLAGAFNQMADALARDRHLRRTMIADIAHELHTPLSIIQANLEAMLDGVLPASMPEIASLHDETALLSRLVADLRLLSLAEAGQLKLERAPTHLGDVVEKVAERMELQARDRDVSLATEVAAGLPALDLDADRIGQAVGNLVSNALRYTPPGGRVVLRAYPRPGAAGRAAVVVEVGDTGSGIAPEDLPYVFERFYRADKSRSRASGGSGIGLAIVKQLVEAHAGQVEVESRPGQGATFRLVLPAAPATN
jgi:signal transduction histidine kinase